MDIHVDNAEKLYRKCFPSNNSKHFNPEASPKSDIVKIVKTHNEWINSALLFCQKLPGDLTTSQDDEHDKYILLIRDFQFILWEAGVDLKERVNISEYYFEALNNINKQNCNVLLKDPVSCINSYTSLLEKISSFCMLSDIYIEQLGLTAAECPLNVLGENLKEQDQDFVQHT